MKDDNENRALEIAENAEFGKVRIIYHDPAYMFAGKDVAKALGYKRPENAVTQHCKGILKLGIPSAGGVQETRFITEGDVYRLIIRSIEGNNGRIYKVDDSMDLFIKHAIAAAKQFISDRRQLNENWRPE